MFDLHPHSCERLRNHIAHLIVLVCVLALIAFSPNAIAQSVNCSGVSAWAANTPYSIGQLVTYSGIEYKCIQAHTSEIGWEPPITPALWQQMGTCSTSATPTPKPTAIATPKPTATATPKGTATATPIPTATTKPTATPTPNPEQPYGGTAWTLPGTIQAENFDTGGDNIGYFTANNTNQGGQYRTSEGVSIEATTDTGGGYDVGWTAAGEWLRYTVNITASGSYTIQVRVANNATGGTFHFNVDGATATSELTLPNTGGWQNWTTLSTGITLTAGRHVIQLAMDTAGSTGNVGNLNWFSIGTGSVAAQKKQEVLNYLASISGNHTAIGVEDKSGGVADSNQMSSMAGNGQYPSFWSADFGFGSAATPSAREAIVQRGEAQWAKGAIVQYIYHACPLVWGSNEQGCDYSSGSNPIDGSYNDLTAAQWTDLTTPGGTLYGVWTARLDTLATYFQELKNAGVAPLFRPLHEMNGSWAWWQGRPGSTGSLRFYQITHDYLVNTKGLDNIIWVWNVQDYTTLASDVNVYSPGTSYFDIAALDVYNTGYTTGNYNAMVGAAHGKPIGVAECAYLPYPATLSAQPLWTYVAVWPDFLYSPYQSNNSAQIPQLFNDSQVIPLSKMPGW